MASGNQPVFGSFTTSCLDDIPFRIGNKFLAPQKVILPPDLELSRPSVSHVSDTEYTFEVEEAVLKWSEERERQIEEQRRYEEERRTALAKQAALEQQARELQAEQGAEGCGSENQNQGQAVTGSQNSPDYENTRELRPQVPPRPGVANQVQPNNQVQQSGAPLKPYFPNIQVPNPLLANISNDILKPTLINQTNDCDQINKVNGSAKDTSAFDVTLFEKEDDPFDNLELQTINVLEELKTVLEETNKTSSPSPQMGQDIDGSSMCSETHVEQVVDSVDTLHLDSAQTNDIPFYENVDQLKNKSENSEAKTSSDLDKIKLPPVPPRRDLVGKSMPLPPIGGFGASTVTNTDGNTTICNQNVSQSWNGIDFTQNTPVNHNVQSQNVHYDNVGLTVQNPIPKPPRQFKYSRHVDDIESSATADSVEETEVVNILPKTGVGEGLGVQFRNTRSNPEIQSAGTDGIARPRPVPAPRRSRSPPSRPSSGQSWNRYSPLPPPPVSNHTPANNTCPVVSPKPTPSPIVIPKPTPSPKPIPSPKPAVPTPSPAVARSVPSRPAPEVPVKSPEERLYGQLSNEARTTVDNLVLMGFNKGRASRAVQNLGSDEKEVVEHLCLVDQLTEKGHNLFLAETALLLFNNNSKKALSYLELFSQLQELGFNGEKIKEALVKTNIDREQTLDILTATS